MRAFILTALLAATSVLSFTAPSQAGGYGDSGRQYAQDYSYEPVCIIKKIRTYDKWGNLVIKKVRVCR